MPRKVDDAANFVFTQLTEQQPGIYDKPHPFYARRDKIDLAWERISHEMKESGMCVYVCVYLYIYIITKTYNRVQIQNISAKAMQTTATIWPVLCDTSQQLGQSSSSTIISLIQIILLHWDGITPASIKT
jgi:hypothetical protein